MFAFEVKFLSFKGFFFQSCSESKLIPILHIYELGIRKHRLEVLLLNHCVYFCSLLNLSESSFLLRKIEVVIPVSDLVEMEGGMYWGIKQDRAKPLLTSNS